jgi:hypothetical protein
MRRSVKGVTIIEEAQDRNDCAHHPVHTAHHPHLPQVSPLTHTIIHLWTQPGPASDHNKLNAWHHTMSALRLRELLFWRRNHTQAEEK